MQVSELHQLVDWVDVNIRQSNLQAHYQQMTQALQQNTARRNNQPPVSFESQKVQLFNTLEEINILELNLSQQKLLTSLKLDSLLGQSAIDQIEDILFRNQLDIVNAHKQFSSMQQKLNSGYTLLNQLKQPLDAIQTDAVDEDTLRKNETLMRVHFQHHSSISNMEEFSSWGERWKSISDGFTFATGGSVQDIRITGASKGSVILELVANTTLIGMIGGGIKWTLDSIKTGLEIRHQIVATQKLKIEKKTQEVILQQLQEAQKAHRKESIDDITEKLIEEHKLNEDGDRGDIRPRLKPAVRELYDFIDGGGEVDFTAHEEQEPEQKVELLTQNISDVRTLTEELKAIEFKPSKAMEPSEED